MSIEQNKAVVRRYITEVLVGGNVELVDDLFAQDYVNAGMGGMDRACFKAWLHIASAGRRSGSSEALAVRLGCQCVLRCAF